MMTANAVEPASLPLQLFSNKVGGDFITVDVKIAQALRSPLDALMQAIKEQETGT